MVFRLFRNAPKSHIFSIKITEKEPKKNPTKNEFRRRPSRRFFSRSKKAISLFNFVCFSILWYSTIVSRCFTMFHGVSRFLCHYVAQEHAALAPFPVFRLDFKNIVRNLLGKGCLNLKDIKDVSFRRKS